MSPGPGSFTLWSRCIRMPIWRCSRTACCAAATDVGRPTLMGSTMPGNSTVLRTGTMMRESDGRDAAAAVGDLASTSATGPLHLAQRDHEATVYAGSPDVLVASAR